MPVGVTNVLDTSTVTSYLDSMTNGVRQLRESRGLSQGQLAQELRVSRQTVNAIETGRYLPSLPLAFAIARLFGRPIEEIFHDDEHV
jgi:putative transcriptional regulator